MLGKKSQLINNLTKAWVVLLIFGTILIFSFVLASKFNTEIQASPSASANAKNLTQKFEDKYSTFDDKAFAIYYIMLIMANVIITSKAKINKWFYIGTLFLIIFTFMFALFVPEIWASYKTNPDLNTSIAAMPITDFMLTYPMPFVAFQLIIVVSVMYFRRGEA